MKIFNCSDDSFRTMGLIVSADLIDNRLREKIIDLLNEQYDDTTKEWNINISMNQDGLMNIEVTYSGERTDELHSQIKGTLYLSETWFI